MEDSTKRREKLQAWRMEAAAAAAAFQSPSSSPPPRAAASLPSFSNMSIRLPPPADSTPAPRFDFYTDPLAAFSGNKRHRGGGAAFAGYSPSSSPHTPSSSFPYAGPRNYPMSSNHPSVPPYNMTQNPYYGQYEMPSQAPHSNTWRSPVQQPTPFSGYSSPSPGNSWNRRSGASSGCDYAKSWTGGFTPQFGRGDSPVGYAGYRGSSHSHPVRGRGCPSKDSPSSHWSGGRGRGFHGSNSSQRETRGYYMGSMVKDPWRKLKPIVGDILEPLGGPTAWLPKRSTTEKAKPSNSGVQFNSKSSLAEYLAASFEEAAEN